ncbi:uncharacterized protein ACBR49_012284 isoform 2-T2 [Aulostomus maculatus]
MHLLLRLCLTWTLICTATSLRCYECTNSHCSNATSIECPVTSTVCKTKVSVKGSTPDANIMVEKNCSSLLNCFTPLDAVTEWSVNKGYFKESHVQMCCATENCNLRSMPVPNPSLNGKQCTSCATSEDSLAGTCNSTVACVGSEDICFNGTMSCCGPSN